MSEFKADCFKEGVCIEAQRIFDSCSDKDCLEDLNVKLDECSIIPDNVSIVKTKHVEISDICINVEPLPYNKGFFSVDITYTFKVTLEAFEKSSCNQCPIILTGTAIFSKRVILFGSEGGTKTFCSDSETYSKTKKCCQIENLPKACIHVTQPIVLDTKLICKSCCDIDSDCCGCCMPNKKCIFISLGVFSIIELSRLVSIMVPIYDYCVPHKECKTSSDSPCELFEKIKFPSDEFFPPALDDDDRTCGCQS